MNQSSFHLNFKQTGGGIEVKGNTFIVKSGNSSIELHFDGLPESETHVFFKNLVFKPKNKNLTTTTILLKCSDDVEKSFIYCTKNYEWYHGQKDFAVNMGWNKEAKTSAKITFEEPGVYEFDELSIECLPLGKIAEKSAALKETALENVQFGTNRINGTINCVKNCVLCVTIPYLKGWNAFVDGKKTKTFKGNIMYLALELKSGEHDIELRYETPFLKLGAVLSALGLLIAIFVLRKPEKQTPTP